MKTKPNVRMNHLKRPFLFVANGLVVLTSALFFILVIVSGMMESLAKEKVSPAELANPDPITRSDAMFLVDFIQTAKAYCWFFGVLLLAIGAVNFFLIPWRSLRPAAASKCEQDGPANGSQPIRSETNQTSSVPRAGSLSSSGMKLLPFILIGMLCGACRSTREQVEPLNFGKQSIKGRLSDVCSLGLSTFEQKHYYFEVTESDLNNAPRWMETAAYPPLSPRDAESAARREARLLRPDVTQWHLDEIALRNVVQDCWCYHVVFFRGDVAITGLPEFLTIPVLMNGHAVHGTTTSRLR